MLLVILTEKNFWIFLQKKIAKKKKKIKKEFTLEKVIKRKGDNLG